MDGLQDWFSHSCTGLTLIYRQKCTIWNACLWREEEDVQAWNYLFIVTVLIAVKKCFISNHIICNRKFHEGHRVSLTQVDPWSTFCLMCCITMFLFVYTHHTHTHKHRHYLYSLNPLRESCTHHDPPYPSSPIFTSQEQGVSSLQLQLVSNTWLPLTVSAWLVFIPFTSIFNPDTEMGRMNNSTI